MLRLLNSSRGWQSGTTPVDDVRWALGRVRERWGSDVPVALVGHSLGGRAALLAATEPQVRSVVAMTCRRLAGGVPSKVMLAVTCRVPSRSIVPFAS